MPKARVLKLVVFLSRLVLYFPWTPPILSGGPLFHLPPSPTAGLLCNAHLVLSAGSRWAGFSLRLGLPLVLSGLWVSLCELVLLAVWVILSHKVWLFPIPTRLRHTYRNTDSTPMSADWRGMARADARWPRRIGMRCGQGHGLTSDAGARVRRKQAGVRQPREWK
ncbi:hypothetical protein K438DRAFT_1762149 [Mycena galopus ATCC 62051]|nr:hypothetical protein K438DRAFT_1762149 [Mycena galopus ATCC 62051]